MTWYGPMVVFGMKKGKEMRGEESGRMERRVH